MQKLCKHLGEPGENINADIKNLVIKGMPEAVQQALDSVRVVGNNAVHPSQIDFTDNAGVANGLFAMLNFICENRITQPKMISQFYQTTVPVDTQGHINKRDGKAWYKAITLSRSLFLLHRCRIREAGRTSHSCPPGS